MPIMATHAATLCQGWGGRGLLKCNKLALEEPTNCYTLATR
jgi:hypothetical protein